MALKRIIEEAISSQGWGTLTGAELKAIITIVNHAENDLESNKGERTKESHEVDVSVSFDGKVCEDMSGRVSDKKDCLKCGVNVYDCVCYQNKNQNKQEVDQDEQ